MKKAFTIFLINMRDNYGNHAVLLSLPKMAMGVENERRFLGEDG